MKTIFNQTVLVLLAALMLVGSASAQTPATGEAHPAVGVCEAFIEKHLTGAEFPRLEGMLEVTDLSVLTMRVFSVVSVVDAPKRSGAVQRLVYLCMVGSTPDNPTLRIARGGIAFKGKEGSFRMDQQGAITVTPPK